MARRSKRLATGRGRSVETGDASPLDPREEEVVLEEEVPQQETQRNRDTGTNGTSAADLTTVIQGMMGMQAQQSEHMHEGFQALLDKINRNGERGGGIRDFKVLKPREFHGTEPAVEAHEWMQHIETVLRAAAVPEAQKVDTVQIQFQGNARSWFDAELIRIGGAFPSWQAFKRSFHQKYFPKDAETAMIRQFANLVQGADSVDEYAGKFEKLSKFAAHTMRDEEDRATKFTQGLNSEIRRFLLARPPDTLLEAVSAARRQEEEGKWEENNRKRDFSTMSGTGFQDGTVQDRPAQSQLSITQRPALLCSKCGKKGHVAKDCRKGLGVCYECGAPDHRLSTCPIKKQKEASKVTSGSVQASGRGRNRGQGQVYALTSGGAEEAGNGISGNLCL